MLVGLYIFLDDDFNNPLYADPDGGELDEELWEALCEATIEAIEGESDAQGTLTHGEWTYGWRHLAKPGLSFVAVVDGNVKGPMVIKYLRALVKQFLDEVDDFRRVDKDGITDVIVDVIPPWEEEED